MGLFRAWLKGALSNTDLVLNAEKNEKKNEKKKKKKRGKKKEEKRRSEASFQELVGYIK